jgi:hypothetical protein
VFQLADLLIKPIQRIQKYHLLVKKILSYSEQANEPPEVIAALRDAVHYTDVIPKNANMMMDVGRLQGFTVRNITLLTIIDIAMRFIINVARHCELSSRLEFVPIFSSVGWFVLTLINRVKSSKGRLMCFYVYPYIQYRYT